MVQFECPGVIHSEDAVGAPISSFLPLESKKKRELLQAPSMKATSWKNNYKKSAQYVTNSLHHGNDLLG